MKGSRQLSGVELLAKLAEPEPPSTDRGVLPSAGDQPVEGETQVSVDYLRVTVWADWLDVAQLAQSQLLSVQGDDVWQEAPGRPMGYSRIVKADRLSLYIEPRGEDTEDRCTLEIPGQPARELGSYRLRSFLIAVESMGWRWRASRIDLAGDTTAFTPEEFYGEVSEGRVRTGVSRKGEWLQWIRGHVEDRKTTTVQLGRRAGGQRFLRVYDAHGFTRVELECKDERAAALGRLFVESAPEELGALVIGQVRDFVELGTIVHTERGNRMTLWTKWAAFCGALTRLRVPLTRAPITLERAIGWLRTGVAPTLAAVHRATGADLGVLVELLADGRRRWGPRHRLLIAQAGLVAAPLGGGA